jgi:6-phosphogluconolactonase
MTPRLALAFALSLAPTLSAFGEPAKPPASGKYWVFFGTYTNGKSTSKGIYRAEFDLATGKLSAPELAAEMANPTFLTLSPDGKTLYAIGEISGQGPKKNEGAVVAFRVDPATGGLTKLNELTTGGPGPCHVNTDATGKYVITANYGGGSCALYTTKPDGSLDARTTFIQHEGSSVNKARQAGPHAHCGFFDATGKLAFVTDLGLDKVLVYKLNPADGTMTANDPAFVKLPDGAGPRHLHINAANDTAYVCGELDSTVNVVKMDPEKGKFEVVQSLSTLPQPTGGNSTAEVRIHPTGKFVYVSNRGHDSVAVFRVDADTGKLTAAGHAKSADVKVPRNFNIDPTGKWMLIASQNGDNVAVFAIDPETGMPKATGEKVTLGRPVCVKFLAKP